VVTQPLAATLPVTSPNRQLIATRSTAGSAPLAVLAPSLARNSIVAIALQLKNARDVVACSRACTCVSTLSGASGLPRIQPGDAQ